jgi:hypothetical protein
MGRFMTSEVIKIRVLMVHIIYIIGPVPYRIGEKYSNAIGRHFGSQGSSSFPMEFRT